MTKNYEVEEKLSYPGATDQPLIIRLLAHFFSYLFHPIFIPLYVTWFLAFVHPYYFVGFPQSIKLWVLLRVGYNMVFFPLVSVLLLKAVGFIDSVFLKTQKDRIIPIIASNLFFFWMYLVFHNQTEIPLILTSFTFGVFLASSFALLANIYFKISLHAIGVGGLLGLMLVILYTDSYVPVTLPLMIAILICGLVCTSRLIVGRHYPFDIYAGLFVGMISQFLAAWFIL
jgi:PAP2 superfamily.